MRFDVVACETAAHVFVREWRARRQPDTVAVVLGDTAGLPRLRCECLFLEP
ncbi:hypothetical protein [Nocardia amamiensis]|uniref:hypothetical protein n=1 Tax=Nocardia amamiensis TaxID=404578 RepID=UPI0033F16254